MKTTLQLLLFFFTCGSFAQITLEHTYFDNAVTRIKLEYSGEKYYALKKATNELIFYNADHTIWKTIVLAAPAPTQLTSTKVFHVSEAKINPDTNIEIIFGYFNAATTSYESKIISESGTVLLTISNATSVSLNEIPGLPDKLITENSPINVNSKVYSAPGLSLENTYTNGHVKRIKLENSGEKYYSLDKANNNAKIYNANHSLWKTVSLPKIAAANYTDIDFVSETQINPDALLEIGYAYSETVSNSTQYEAKIVNENNGILLTVPNSNRLQISSLQGLEDKLIAENTINYVQSSNVYSLPSLTLENAYQSQVKRVKLENSGEKYYTFAWLLNNQVKIYNSNHTLWKTINLPLVQIENSPIVNILSETIIDPNAIIELAYTFNTGLLNGVGYSSKVIDENGAILLDAEYVQDLYVSKIQGLKNKLIGYNYAFFNNTYIGKVYSIETLGTLDNSINDKVVMAPNPAKSFININSLSIPIIEATIYNMNGIIVKKEIAQNITKIDINQLPAGIYIVNLTDFNNQKSTHKITVLH